MSLQKEASTPRPEGIVIAFHVAVLSIKYKYEQLCLIAVFSFVTQLHMRAGIQPEPSSDLLYSAFSRGIYVTLMCHKPYRPKWQPSYKKPLHLYDHCMAYFVVKLILWNYERL